MENSWAHGAEKGKNNRSRSIGRVKKRKGTLVKRGTRVGGTGKKTVAHKKKKKMMKKKKVEL